MESESSLNSQASISGSSSQGVSSSIRSTTDANGQTHTQIMVNGQEVEVPANGSVNETIDTANGQVHVNVNSNNSNSSTSISTHSHSSTHSQSSQTYTQQGDAN